MRVANCACMPGTRGGGTAGLIIAGPLNSGAGGVVAKPAIGLEAIVDDVGAVACDCNSVVAFL